MVVAITKCDLPGAEPARVRRELVEAGVELEDVGGDVQVCRGSGIRAWTYPGNCDGTMGNNNGDRISMIRAGDVRMQRHVLQNPIGGAKFMFR